jgi:hypothetical protein
VCSSDLNNTLRQVGAALGIAVIGAVLATTLSLSARSRLNGVTDVPDFVKTAIVSSLDQGASIGEGSLRVTGAPAGMESSAAFKAVGEVIKQSFVDATRAAGLIASIFVMLGAVSSLLIPTTIRRAAKDRGVGAQDRGRGASGPKGASHV